MAFSCFNSGRVLFLLSALLFFATTEATPIDDLLPVCKTVGGGNRYVGIQFCMDALHSDPRSENVASNYKELAVIAVDLLTANATTTKAKIDGLLGGNAEDAAKRCLRSCQALYGGILQRQPGCAAAVKNGRFSEATSSLEKSAAAAKECENGFSKTNVASPVTVEDDDAFQLAKLAVALLGA